MWPANDDAHTRHLARPCHGTASGEAVLGRLPTLSKLLTLDHAVMTVAAAAHGGRIKAKGSEVVCRPAPTSALTKTNTKPNRNLNQLTLPPLNIID
jgi:hypothetical protein